MADPDFLFLGLHDLTRELKSGRLSARDLMGATLDRVDRVNPIINAIVSLRDRETLLGEAAACDADFARGHWRGPLHGVPQAIKDLAMAAGLPTILGSPTSSPQAADQDSFHVARIRGAGAIVIGKTNTPEFGLGSHTYNPVFGATANPDDTSKSAGGSSGGAAAALAARLLPAADGSDMMGSLRNPAAFNNVIGLRPSYGRVPGGPAPDCYFDTMATDGPMARSVGDVALLLSVQAGYDARAPHSLDGDGGIFAGSLTGDIAGTRIGWLGDLGGYLPFEDEILDLNRTALGVFEQLGARIEDVDLGFDPARIWEAWTVLRHWRVAAKLGALYDDAATRDRLKPEAIWEIEQGRALTIETIEKASQTRSAWHLAALRLFERHDYLVAPSAQVFPFDIMLDWPKTIAGRAMDTYHRWMETVVGASLLGLPALALPAGFGTTGLPTGFQLIGRPRDDLGVLRLGFAYDAATGWTRNTPKLG